MLLTCIASEESVTLDGIMVGNEDEKSMCSCFYDYAPISQFIGAEWEDKWEKEGNGMMATKYVTFVLDIQKMQTANSLSSGLDAAIKYRPSEAEVKTIGPAFEKKWKDYYADHPDRAVMWLGVGAL